MSRCPASSTSCDGRPVLPTTRPASLRTKADKVAFASAACIVRGGSRAGSLRCSRRKQMTDFVVLIGGLVGNRWRGALISDEFGFKWKREGEALLAEPGVQIFPLFFGSLFLSCAEQVTSFWGDQKPTSLFSFVANVHAERDLWIGHVTLFLWIVWIVCRAVQKIPETKELVGPRGALWCLHLHINEKLWCTLETTKTLSSLREQSSYKNMLTLKYLLCITLITLINEAAAYPRGSLSVLPCASVIVQIKAAL